MNTEPRALPRVDIPLALLAIVLLIQAGLQSYAMWTQYGNLTTLHAAQTPTIQQSQKIRDQVSALASKTSKLADSGDAGAKAVIDDLKRQGITVKPTP